MPQYESLSLKEIKQFIADHPACHKFFPIDREMEKLPKQWIVNVIYSSIGKDFADWVKARVIERNTNIVKVRQLGIDMDPGVFAAFQ